MWVKERVRHVSVVYVTTYERSTYRRKQIRTFLPPCGICKTCEHSVCYNMVKKYIQENANKDDIAPPHTTNKRQQKTSGRHGRVKKQDEVWASPPRLPNMLV